MFTNFSTILQHLIFLIPATYMALFHVVNPIGSGILFLNLTPDANNVLRRKLARKVALNSFIILVVTLLVGVYILKLFGITIPIVQMCGGMLILSIGWRALNQDDSAKESADKKAVMTAETKEHTYVSQTFYPYTFPFTIGPGSIAVTLTISAETITAESMNAIQFVGAIIALVLICVTIYICYSSADYLMGRISEQIRKVIMKILSFILLCIGGQIIMNGFVSFLHYLHETGVIKA